MINNTEDSTSSSVVDVERVDDLDAVASVLLDQGGRCARCDKANLFPQQAHGWTTVDDDYNPVVNVLCGHCSRPDRAQAFMVEQATKQSRIKAMDRAAQTLALADMFTASRRSRRDVEHEPTTDTSTEMVNEELPPGVDVRRPGVGFVTGVR